MERTRIKICGIRRPQDALAAARAGADAIGLVFHPSSQRNISIESAREILQALPPFVTAVGLFVDAGMQEVTQTATALGLRHVQLHGDETPDDVARLTRFSVIKAVRVERDRLGQVLATWRQAVQTLPLSHLRGLVLETGGTARPGGTGVVNDWQAVKREKEAGAFDGLPHLIAAGGLTPRNVGQVVRDVRPWAVDVSSGVEEQPGIKSEALVRAFMNAVREAANP